MNQHAQIHDASPAARLSFERDRRAVVALVTALSLIPLGVAVGVGVDMSRLSMAKTALQSAADGAALAGAAAYQTPGNSGAAQTVATTYFNRTVGMQTALLASPSVTVSAAAGNYSPTIQGYNVTVTASATLQTTFLALASVTSVAVKASATASNPVVQPVIKPRTSAVGSSAGDWNSTYLYAVPMLSNGSADFSHYPSFSQWYQISSNCGSGPGGSTSHNANSQCNGWPGAVVPSTQSYPTVTATQPLAFVMFNMTAGQASTGSAGYTNQYGAVTGDIHFQGTALMAFNAGPAGLSDAADSYVNQFFPTMNHKNNAATHYSDVNNSSTPNCGLLIQVVDPNNLPTSPPLPSGACYSLSNSAAGLQYANLSCSQMAGRTFMYWFNDMGGGVDDKDYNDMYFTVSCSAGSGTSTAGTTVALLR